VLLLALLMVPALPAALASAQAAKPAKKDPTAPEAVQVVRGDLEEIVKCEGTLVPAEAVEVSLWLDEYRGDLLVLEALPDGSPVNEGDVVVRLDLRKIDEQLGDARFGLEQSQEQNRLAEAKSRLAEESERDDLVRDERGNDWAQRRLRGYLEHEKAHQGESERLRTQSETNRLEDQRDELQQLEKMYKEDELVDATEEIVLKRSRRSLAYYQASVDLQRRIRAYRRELNDVIRQEELELDAAQKAAALDRKRRSTELAEVGRRLERERSRRAFGKQQRALERLQGDREKMVVRAPRRGIVLHGEAKAPPGAGKLERGSTVRARQVFLTVAEPDQFKVVTRIGEKDLGRAKTGKAARVKIAAVPGLELTGAIRVAPLATGRDAKGNNQYETLIPLEASDPRLEPRMQCSVSIVIDAARNAILVPSTAVVKRDGAAFLKCGPSAKGPFLERRVTLGCTDGKRVVVKDGIEAGAFVQVPGKAKK